ncbi:MAG: hypothetical protein LUH47_01160 [Clostridiales bacterium]|nr:hypothetical protein [Clostridiales bacterium]
MGSGTETVYYISGLTNVTENDLAGYNYCNLCSGNDIISSEGTVYEGFEINGIEFSAKEMGYIYIVGFKISDSGDSDISDDDISGLADAYSLKLVSEEV